MVPKAVRSLLWIGMILLVCIIVCNILLKDFNILSQIVTIDSVISEVNILPTKTKPKKLVFVGSDGKR